MSHEQTFEELIPDDSESSESDEGLEPNNDEESEEESEGVDQGDADGEECDSNENVNMKRKKYTHRVKVKKQKLDAGQDIENEDALDETMASNTNDDATSSDSNDGEGRLDEGKPTTKTAKGGGGKGSGKKRQRKSRHFRRNIRNLFEEQNLLETTKEARAEEAKRLKRLLGNQSTDVHRVEDTLQPEATPSAKAEVQNGHEQSLIHLVSSDEGEKAGLAEEKIQSGPPPHESDSDVKILSDDQLFEEDELEDDPEKLGLHVDDRLNVPEADGRILINKGHPPSDEDVCLAPQFQGIIKPHQVGGIRFLYDNLIESTSRFDHSHGFGCILAHSMGLGKTLQVIAFSDIFLRHTSGKHILCIVPINTIQNWLSEYNHWIPAAEEVDPNINPALFRPRNFKLHLLNDALKNLEQRAKVIMDWKVSGGVLLMGYELYRLLASKTQRKKRKTKKDTGPVCIDIEEEDKEKSMLDEIHKLLVNPGPDLVICDEGHRIKNSHASISQSLKSIRTRRRVVLTGYPLQNNLIEYWCMVDFVRPNFLGTRTEFSNMFERPIQNGQCVDSTPRDVRLMMHRVHVLQQQLQGFVQRRGHQVLRISLPPKREYVLLVRMTPYQRKLYRLFMEELINQRNVSNPLKAFAVCCKIWNHPDVLYNFVRAKEESEDLDIEWEDDSVNGKQGVMTNRRKGTPKKKSLSAPPTPVDTEAGDASNSVPFFNIGQGFSPFPAPLKKDEISYDWTSGCFDKYIEGQAENSHKMIIFFDILENTIRAGDRLLLFSQSLFTLNLLEDYLKRKQLPESTSFWCPGVNYFRLDGSTPAQERERLINAFNSQDSVKLFLVSTRAGSLGINLIGANRVIVFDASWNPCHDSQAVCRVYRYGQRKVSHIYRFVTDNSLEKKIYDRQVNKQGMADRVIDEHNPEARLSSREIQRLICDDERDPEPNSWDVASAVEALRSADPVLANIVENRSECFSTAPFTHESLLVDRKEKKLSRAEKRMALINFEMEKSAKISYTRQSYAAYYPKPQGSSVVGGKDLLPPASASSHNASGFNAASSWHSNRYSGGANAHSASGESIVYNQNQRGSPGPSTFPLPTLEHPTYPAPRMCAMPPVQQPLPPYVHGRQQHAQESYQNLSSGSSSPCSSRFPIEALLKQKDISIEETTLQNDMTIPTNNPDEPAIHLSKGQQVMFIRSPKGVYLKLRDKIIKIRVPINVLGAMRNLRPTVQHSTPQNPPQVVTIGSSSDSETQQENINLTENMKPDGATNESLS